MNIAVILAGGSGKRIGVSSKPKQYQEIAGMPILCHTIEPFLLCSQIDRIVVATHAAWFRYTVNILEQYDSSRISICEGGVTRQDSLYNALEYCRQMLNASDDTIITSHDAARPFVTLSTIENCLKAMVTNEAVTAVIPAADTIIQSSDTMLMSGKLDRNTLYQVQTPQLFRLGTFIDVYRSLSSDYLERATDAIGILFEKGIRIALVPGEPSNFKITTGYDLKIAEYMMSLRKG